jgi:hypothetical protein
VPFCSAVSRNVLKTLKTPNCVVFLFWLGKGLLPQNFTRFWDNKLQKAGSKYLIPLLVSKVIYQI